MGSLGERRVFQVRVGFSRWKYGLSRWEEGSPGRSRVLQVGVGFSRTGGSGVFQVGVRVLQVGVGFSRTGGSRVLQVGGGFSR